MVPDKVRKDCKLTLCTSHTLVFGGRNTGICVGIFHFFFFSVFGVHVAVIWALPRCLTFVVFAVFC